MKALKMTDTRRRDQVVILTGVRYGSKLSTPRRAARRLSPFARFCLQMFCALLFALSLLTAFIMGGETALAVALSLALPFIIYGVKKGGLL